MSVGGIMKDKKIFIYVVVLIVAVFLVTILSFFTNKQSGPTEDSLKFKGEYEALNSSIPMSIEENNPIKYATFEEVEQLLTSGTGVIYFGFPSCPWCRNMIPVLFDVAKGNNYDTIYYLNPRDLKVNENNYNKLIEILSPYLKELDGEKVLYVPDVYFVKNGQVVGHHLSTVESQTDPRVSLNEQQIQELFDIYQNLFNKIK